jgi:TRAP-type C4-dicarboxylate transport system permease small subunit
MNATRILAILLIAAGLFGLVYGGFTYTKKTHEAQIGSLELSVQETETVDLPIWAGVAAIVGGAVLLLVGARKR